MKKNKKRVIRVELDVYIKEAEIKGHRGIVACSDVNMKIKKCIDENALRKVVEKHVAELNDFAAESFANEVKENVGYERYF